MDQLLEDYKSYYMARRDRYAGDAFFTNSYASEDALYEAMDSCQELIEFKEKLGDLNIKNAIALVKDQETARLNHFTEIKESVRAIAPQWILEKIDTAGDANDVITISSEMEQKASLAISLDGFMDAVWSDFIPQLETIEVTEKAEIPSQYENERQSQVQELKAKLQEAVQELHVQARLWEPTWQLDLNLIWEFRHRNKIPLPTEILEKRINQLKNYC